MTPFGDYDYRYLGNFSATPPWFDVSMRCDNCRVRWTGCWDNFQCPICGEGELPMTNTKDQAIDHDSQRARSDRWGYVNPSSCWLFTWWQKKTPRG